MLDRQSSHAVDFRVAASCCNKPYRPLRPWWTGSRLSQEVTVQVSEQATSQNFGSPAALTSISSREIAPGATPKLLYEPFYQVRNILKRPNNIGHPSFDEVKTAMLPYFLETAVSRLLPVHQDCKRQ